MIIHLYCIRLFIYICYDEFHWGKEDKMRGGGGVLRKKLRGGGMQERGKEDKMRGGVAKKIWKGMGRIPERVKKKKCGGLRKKKWGVGLCRRG